MISDAHIYYTPDECLHVSTLANGTLRVRWLGKTGWLLRWDAHPVEEACLYRTIFLNGAYAEIIDPQHEDASHQLLAMVHDAMRTRERYRHPDVPKELKELFLS